MTFQPSIPQAADLISVSQGDLLNNFTAIGTSFDVNHIDFNAAGSGKHKFCSFPEQGASPGTAANEVAIYSKDVGGVSQLFFQREGLAPGGADIQMTTGNPIAAQPGTTFLPGGMLLNFGAVAATSLGVSQNFATAFTASIYSVSLAVLNNVGTTSATMTLTGLTAIKIYSSIAGPITVYYMVIGK